METLVLVIIAAIAAYTAYDAYNRKMGGGTAALWGIGTFIICPVIFPIYMAKRPLKDGEVREGGFAWNLLKNFALVWTVLMAFATMAGIGGAAETTEAAASDAEKAGAAIGMGLGVCMLGTVWFVPMVGAMVLGFFLKKDTKEEGPTGPLAEPPRQ